MLRLRVKHLISGVLSVSAWCVAFVFGHRYDADAVPVVGNKLTCGQSSTAFTNSNRVSTGYSFDDAGTGVCVFVCQRGYAYVLPGCGTYTGCSSSFTGTDYNSAAWYAWTSSTCYTGCRYSGYESTAATGLTNAVYNKIGAGVYFYTGAKNVSYATVPFNCVAVRSYVKFSCGAGSPNSSAVSSGRYVGAMGAMAGASITLPPASNCTAPAGKSFSQWMGS